MDRNPQEEAEANVAAMKMMALAATAPLKSTLADLVKRLDSLPVPKDGRDGADAPAIDMAAVGQMIEDAVAKAVADAVAEIPIPKDGVDGKSVDLADVLTECKAIIEDLPKPRDGVDGKDADAEQVKALVVEAVAAIPVPKDGKDGPPGQSVDVPAVLSDVNEQVAKALSDLQNGKDGVDGENGRDGVDGKSCAPEDVLALVSDKIEKALTEIPIPENGRDGRDGKPGLKGADGVDGKDGFGFDDLTIEWKDSRNGVLKFVKGDRVKEFPLVVPGIEYRGVFKDGESYAKGDCVTWGGSMFIATVETKSKPETDETWKLSVKRGREGSAGRDGKDYAPPKPVKLP